MSDLLQKSQYCGRQGNTIFEAVAAVRDIVASTEVHNVSVCLLTLDFKEVFDRISHDYLQAILREYGFSEKFCTRLQRIYNNAMWTLILNGEISRPIPILSSVRQGCSLIMSLYILCPNPLLSALEKKLAGIKFGPRGTRTSIISYADDVTLIVTKPEEIV
jgi:hypothetical protein